jgi:glycosyltransferase involved in cell wall biosynthesis
VSSPTPLFAVSSPPSVSVVFPAYQEEEFLDTAVRRVVEGLRADDRDFEVLVVENGSRDETRVVADRLAAEFTEVQSRSIPQANYGLALRDGLLKASKDLVVNFDVDLFDLGFLREATARIAAPGGPDLIVASKRGEGADDRRHWTRKVVTGVFSTLLRVGFGLKVSDTHGMKAMRREPAQRLAADCLFGTDLFDTELILRLERAGFRTSEIGVTIEETRPARTPIVSRIFRSVRGLGTLWLALRRERRTAKLH